ncbi:MAG TPA: PilZ domain-containing protein [Hyphomicrobium sp.]|nr:PilZ domain-containing protein [Hyphomicrobium sp.]
MSETIFGKFMSGFQAEVLVPENVSADDDERRRALRQLARQHVAISFRGLRLICDLVDLSQSGAKISVGDGIVPNVGEKATLTLFDGMKIDGTISWLRDKHIGVEFLYPVSDIDERLDFENLGREFFGKAVSLQKSTRRP